MKDRSCGRRAELELQEGDVNAAPLAPRKKRACIQKHFSLLSDCRLIRALIKQKLHDRFASFEFISENYLVYML
jgi:hypothetical protein